MIPTPTYAQLGHGVRRLRLARGLSRDALNAVTAWFS
jgi:hypothetical protein